MTGLPDGYSIRKGVPQDARALSEIERRAAQQFRGHPGLGTSTIDLNDTAPLGFLRSCAREGLLWVLAMGDEAVGFAACEWRDGDFFLVELDVDPAHGRRGLGRALLETICAYGFAHDAPRITLATFTEVEWNRPFYESAGFTVIPEADWTDWMRDSMAGQVEHGLDPAMRCFMGRSG